MRKYMRNPAPELSHKRSDLVISIAMFYKRPFNFEDIQAINPHWCKRPDEVRVVLKRLVSKGYLTESNGYYQMTQFAHQQQVDHMSWKGIYRRDRNKLMGD